MPEIVRICGLTRRCPHNFLKHGTTCLYTCLHIYLNLPCVSPFKLAITLAQMSQRQERTAAIFVKAPSPSLLHFGFLSNNRYTGSEILILSCSDTCQYTQQETRPTVVSADRVPGLLFVFTLICAC